MAQPPQSWLEQAGRWMDGQCGTGTPIPALLWCLGQECPGCLLSGLNYMLGSAEPWAHSWVHRPAWCLQDGDILLFPGFFFFFSVSISFPLFFNVSDFHLLPQKCKGCHSPAGTHSSQRHLWCPHPSSLYQMSQLQAHGSLPYGRTQESRLDVSLPPL